MAITNQDYANLKKNTAEAAGKGLVWPILPTPRGSWTVQGETFLQDTVFNSVSLCGTWTGD